MGKVWMIGAASALGVLLVASVIVALTERESEFESGTPQATVQRFLQAVQASEFQGAYDMLAANLQENCSPERMFGSPSSYNDRLQTNRITLEGTDTVGDATFVTLRIAEFRADGPFGSSERSHDQRYVLQLEGGDWRFVEYPWPLFNCGSFLAPPPIREVPKPIPPSTPTPAPNPRPKPTPAA